MVQLMCLSCHLCLTAKQVSLVTGCTLKVNSFYLQVGSFTCDFKIPTASHMIAIITIMIAGWLFMLNTSCRCHCFKAISCKAPCP